MILSSAFLVFVGEPPMEATILNFKVNAGVLMWIRIRTYDKILKDM